MNFRGKFKYSNIFRDLSGPLSHIVTQVCHLLIQNPWGRCFLTTLQMRWVASGTIFKVNCLKTWTILFHKLTWIYVVWAWDIWVIIVINTKLQPRFLVCQWRMMPEAHEKTISVLFFVLHSRSIFHRANWRDLCPGCMVVKGSMGKLPCRFSIAQQPHQYSISIVY